MVDLPLVDENGNPFGIQPGPASDGAPVLIRNRTFEVNPSINDANGRGAGWSLEVANLPNGTTGFCVRGGRANPTYFAFTFVNTVRSLHILRDGQWTQIATGLVDSAEFGPVDWNRGIFSDPAFVNPYDPNVIYALGTTDVLVSTDSGQTFVQDSTLTQLVSGDLSKISQIGFSYDNPDYIAVGTTLGQIFFSNSTGKWTDLTSLLPTPRAPIISVGIDDSGIYVGTLAHGIWRIGGYMQAWQGWSRILNQTFSQNAPIAAVSRYQYHLDLFGVGPDGGVYTAWWDPVRGWQGWERILNQTFSQNTPIAAVARYPYRLDLFGVAPDGGVYLASW